ncbi:Nucleoporin nup93, variant 2 [Chamberlinius hualienensis]
MMNEESGFGDLLDQAEQLTAQLDGGSELPRVERNLRQLCEAGRQLWNKSAQIGGVGVDSNDVKASMLLGSKGLTLPKISNKLESLTATKALGPLEPLVETNVEGFLRNERENIILSLIEESRATAFARESKMYWEKMENDWDQQKLKILNSFVGSSHDISEIRLNLETSVNQPSSVNVRSAMDNVEITYAKQVTAYNKQVIQGGMKPSLIDLFTAVSAALDDKNVSDLWAMVRCMVNVPVKVGDDLLASRVSLPMQTAFVNQARSYLEETYVKYMKAMVYGNLQQAALGGLPGILQLVRSFMNVKPVNIVGLEDGKVEGQPVWPLIYYCLRSGDLTAALCVARTAGPNLEEFTLYLTEYAHDGTRALKPRSENQFRILYKRLGQACTDPFKKAVFCVVGSCDLKEDHPEVVSKIDDYLWLKLSQIRLPSSNLAESSGMESLSLAQFQARLLEDYGESHFRAYQQPFLYFQVLFLTAQFEAAIEFLSRIDRLRVHAVHVALALFEAKLLALPHSIHAQLISKDPADVEPMRRLNFVRLLTLYTRKFEATDPREALQYFYFLRSTTNHLLLRLPKLLLTFWLTPVCVSKTFSHKHNIRPHRLKYTFKYQSLLEISIVMDL